MFMHDAGQIPDRIIARLAAFSLVGALNTVVGAGVILLAGILGSGPMMANVYGYAVGLTVSYILNSRLTFRSRVSDRKSVLRFMAAFVVAFIMELSVVKIVTDVFPAYKLVGSLSGMPVYTIVFYLLCEYWVFKARYEHSRDQ